MTSMEVTMLGTTAMVPTKDRNHAAVFLQYKAEGILFDCGEGTQRQFKLAGIPMTKTTRVLLTHWHGDHVLGLPGLIQSLGAMEYGRKLHIYGPRKTQFHIAKMFEAFVFDHRIELEIHEIEGGIIHDEEDFFIEALPLKHKVPCLGYSVVEKDRHRVEMAKLKKLGIPEGPHLKALQEGQVMIYKDKEVHPEQVTTLVKGKKVAYITDTLVCDGAIQLARNADLVICESSYAKELQQKAIEHMHLSAHDAGLIASRAGAKKLVITHFSARYKNTHEVEADARDVFDNVIAAKDLMRINV
ncbi:ribonuclease Z [Candidatus Woesearchaeota archaeon]|nr:ribonuclease Z [Candidatus Woesearchaeota archaeon]